MQWRYSGFQSERWNEGQILMSEHTMVKMIKCFYLSVAMHSGTIRILKIFDCGN